MSRFACLWLTLNDGNAKMAHLKSLQSAFYPQCAFYPSLLSAVCSPQSSFYIDRIWSVQSTTDLVFLIPWQLKNLFTLGKLRCSPFNSGNGSWLPWEGLHNYLLFSSIRKCQTKTSSRMWFPAGLFLATGSANIPQVEVKYKSDKNTETKNENWSSEIILLSKVVGKPKPKPKVWISFSI